MINALRGFRDILSPHSELLTKIESKAREIFRLYGYKEMRIPTLERKELFIKSTGLASDIVQKEMYSFTDSGGRLIACRPEGTPGIARAYIEHNLSQSGRNSKFFYISNMFRAERPQAGRYREFEQIGAENIGQAMPAADAESILMLTKLLSALGLGDMTVDINSIGCAKCRSVYRKQLLEYLTSHFHALCPLCKERMELNPLRTLDCKIDGPILAKAAPLMRLCAECESHFEQTKKLLSLSGIKFNINKSLVRGLDYYTRTVFEVRIASKSGQDAIAAGGRYDNLIKSMGGPDTAAIGWAMGADRVAMLMHAPEDRGSEVFVAAYSSKAPSEAAERGFLLLKALRDFGISSDFSNFKASFKSQLRAANKSGANLVFIIGDQELSDGLVSVKPLRGQGEQIQIKFESAAEYAKEILNEGEYGD